MAPPSLTCAALLALGCCAACGGDGGDGAATLPLEECLPGVWESSSLSPCPCRSDVDTTPECGMEGCEWLNVFAYLPDGALIEIQVNRTQTQFSAILPEFIREARWEIDAEGNLVVVQPSGTEGMPNVVCRGDRLVWVDLANRRRSPSGFAAAFGDAHATGMWTAHPID